MESILNLDDATVGDQLLAPMPDKLSSTVLHYVCTSKNYKVSFKLIEMVRLYFINLKLSLLDGKIVGGQDQRLDNV